MSEQKLEPHRVTKPIQLLAAWLVGLFVIDGSFLSAAKILDKPDWLPPLLVIAAIINVPLFLICIFLLQTKFRPEMQEDAFYSTYIQARLTTQSEVEVAQSQLVLAESKDRLAAIEDKYQKSLESLNIESSQLENLKETYQRLERAHRVETIENITHELQTRLQTLIANTENFLFESNERTPTKEDIAAQSRKILQSAFAIDAFLQNYRFDIKDDFAFKVERIDKLILNSVSIYEYEASNKNLKFLINLEPVGNRPPHFAISHNQMQLAFNNIIYNAVKYSYRGNEDMPNEIKIIGKPSNDFYSITFENSGVGISEHEANTGLIFQPGYIGQHTLKEVRPGAGMGLYITKQIIERHSGAIEVQSNSLPQKKGLHQFQLRILLPYARTEGALERG